MHQFVAEHVVCFGEAGREGEDDASSLMIGEAAYAVGEQHRCDYPVYPIAAPEGWQTKTNNETGYTISSRLVSQRTVRPCRYEAMAIWQAIAERKPISKGQFGFARLRMQLKKF